MTMRLIDEQLGTAAIDLARHGHPEIARLLGHAHLFEDYKRTRDGGYYIAILTLPVDILDEWHDEFNGPTLAALQKAAEWSGRHVRSVRVSAAPEADGWRDRLNLISDWKPATPDDWWSLNEKLDQLKEVHRRAVTAEDFKDVGRRSRDLLIAAMDKVFRPSMVVEGDVPKGADAKAKFDHILGARIDGSRNTDLRKFMRATWDLANALTHTGDDRSVDAFASAQATVALVRLLAQLDDELNS